MRTIIVNAACLVVLLATAGFTAGCGTAQSPRRQVEDTAITAEVKKKMASDVGLSSVTNIDVNTTNGVVTLAGQVESEEVRDQAEQIARSVNGVVAVNNHLQVEAAGSNRQELPETTRNHPA